MCHLFVFVKCPTYRKSKATLLLSVDISFTIRAYQVFQKTRLRLNSHPGARSVVVNLCPLLHDSRINLLHERSLTFFSFLRVISNIKIHHQGALRMAIWSAYDSILFFSPWDQITTWRKEIMNKEHIQNWNDHLCQEDDADMNNWDTNKSADEATRTFPS